MNEFCKKEANLVAYFWCKGGGSVCLLHYSSPQETCVLAKLPASHPCILSTTCFLLAGFLSRHTYSLTRAARSQVIWTLVFFLLIGAKEFPISVSHWSFVCHKSSVSRTTRSARKNKAFSLARNHHTCFSPWLQCIAHCSLSKGPVSQTTL